MLSIHSFHRSLIPYNIQGIELIDYATSTTPVNMTDTFGSQISVTMSSVYGSFGEANLIDNDPFDILTHQDAVLMSG